MIGDTLRTLIWVNKLRAHEGQAPLYWLPPNLPPLHTAGEARINSCPVAKALPGRDANVSWVGVRYTPYGSTIPKQEKLPRYVDRYIAKKDRAIR